MAEGLREFDILAEDKEIEMPFFPDFQRPFPLKVTEGDRVRIRFANAGSHAHTMHFHGIHAARMDGVPGAGEAAPGKTFIYEFDAFPFGCHLYHCHSVPLKRHIHKGPASVYRCAFGSTNLVENSKHQRPETMKPSDTSFRVAHGSTWRDRLALRSDHRPAASSMPCPGTTPGP